MTFRGRRVQIDWGHLVVLCLISGATVWYLLDDRSRFDEGKLNGDENSDSDPAQAVHG